MTEEEIKACAEADKYKITTKEWNFIKKQITDLLKHDDFEVSYSKSGKDLDIRIKVPFRYIDPVAVVCENYHDHRPACQKLNNNAKILRSKVDAIVSRHQIVHDESDSMTDYPGVYRLTYYLDLGAKEEDMAAFDKVLAKMREELQDQAPSPDDFPYEIFNKYALDCGVNILWEEYL